MPETRSGAVPATGTQTIMFTDLVGSTALRLALGEKRFVEVIEEHDGLLGDIIRWHGGTVVKHTGDGLMAAFAAASQGVAAAVEIQRCVDARNEQREPPIGIRIGVGAGDVAERLGDYHGVAVVEASRLCAVATGGQILASDQVCRLAGSNGGFDYVALGELDLKGLPAHESVAVRWTDEAPVAAPVRRAQGNLPAGVDRFIGRGDDLEGVARIVRSQRFVTLTGPGGSGKTRLALEVAARLAVDVVDAAWLVPLADLDDGRLIVETTIAALAIRDGGEPAEVLRSHLSRGLTLLVLDNCEHVVDDAASFVADLLASCPDLHVLATSREPLQVPGEREYGVEPLSTSEAVELLVERRPASLLPSDVGDDALVRICEAVDGLPLAVELAAARLRVLSPEQVADRLDDQLAVLTGTGRSRPDRQQTLRATLDWSHDLLSDDERVVFRRLAVFAGGFTMGAAQRVAAGGGLDGDLVADLVEMLATRSLVGPAPGDGGRLRMLEPVRQYAGERLEASGELPAVRARHLAWSRELAARLGRGFFTDQRAATELAALEHANVCHALDFALRTGRVQDASAIIASTVYLWIMTGQPDGRRWVDRIRAACPADAPAGVRGDATFAAAMFAVNEGDEHRSVPLLREALSHFEADGRARSHAWVLTWYGRAGRAGIGEVDGRTPEQWFAQALDEFEALGDGAGMGWSLTLLARCALRVGDLALADERARSALDLAEAGGIDQVAANAHRWLAVIAHARGDTGRADELIARATQEHEDSGDRWHQAIALATAAGLAVGRQDIERAADVLTAAFAIVDELPGADEAMAHVLVAALNFLVHTGHGTEVASIVGGLSASDNALVERVALIQDPEHLRVDLATVQPDPPDGQSLTSAMARASTIVAEVTARV